jgi:hypothetical protein
MIDNSCPAIEATGSVTSSIFTPMRPVLIFVLCFLLLKTATVMAEGDSLTGRQTRHRKTILISGTALLGAGSIVYLNEAWYKNYRSSTFHFFNDNSEWLQMDKAGHVFSTYQTGRLMMQAFDWAGYSRNQKLFIGGGMGLYYMTMIECFDGFSEGWGFSWGDMFANTLGAASAVSQEAFWGEQRIQLKFYYSSSGLAGYNAALLGESAYTRPIKDYNGQSYWLSFTPVTFLKHKSNIPAWLNISLGYGAYGMIGANENPTLYDSQGNEIKFDRYRRFFLSLDLDLSRIPVKSKWLKTIFSVLNIVKFPAPTLEFSEGSFKVHTFYP